jgi:hypothetical protein
MRFDYPSHPGRWFKSIFSEASTNNLPVFHLYINNNYGTISLIWNRNQWCERAPVLPKCQMYVITYFIMQNAKPLRTIAYIRNFGVKNTGRLLSTFWNYFFYCFLGCSAVGLMVLMTTAGLPQAKKKNIAQLRWAQVTHSTSLPVSPGAFVKKSLTGVTGSQQSLIGIRVSELWKSEVGLGKSEVGTRNFGFWKLELGTAD